MRLTQYLFQQARKVGKRRRVVFFNNKWQEYRERRVVNLEVEEKMLDRGINVRPIEVVALARNVLTLTTCVYAKVHFHARFRHYCH